MQTVKYYIYYVLAPNIKIFILSVNSAIFLFLCQNLFQFAPLSNENPDELGLFASLISSLLFNYDNIYSRTLASSHINSGHSQCTLKVIDSETWSGSVAFPGSDAQRKRTPEKRVG